MVSKTRYFPLSIDDYDFKTRRKKNLSLNVNGIQRYLDYNLPSVSNFVELFYNDYVLGLPNKIKKGII